MEVRGQSVKCKSVNLFNECDTAFIKYDWRGLGKCQVVIGSILSYHSEGIGKRKIKIIFNQ